MVTHERLMNTDNTVEQKVTATGRRAQQLVRIYDREHLKVGKAFRTSDQHAFGVHQSGAFIRLDKDKRSPKERKRARREAREAKSA